MAVYKKQASAKSSTGTMDFRQVHEQERSCLSLSADLKTPDGVGLALSGGGIRSASFSLGVLQVLLNEDLFKRIDYVATVSGGGYLGAALSWWLHLASTDSGLPDEKTEHEEGVAGDVTVGQRRYEAFREQFGSKVKGARTLNNADLRSPWNALNWLSYIRQHGNYLLPPRVGYAALIATALRVCLYSFSVYAGTLVGVFALLRVVQCYWDTWERSFPILRSMPRDVVGVAAALDMAPDPLVRFGLLLALFSGGLLVAMNVLYGPATWLTSLWGVFTTNNLYIARTHFRKYSGGILAVAVVGLLVASVPWLYSIIQEHFSVWLAAVPSLGLGTLGSIIQFVQGRTRQKTSGWGAQIRLIVTAALVSYGLLLSAYAIAQTSKHPLLLAQVTLVCAIVFGFFVNINFAGWSRLYRDRLMEAFLPNLETVATNDWQPATQADAQSVSDLRGRVTSTGELKAVTVGSCPRPLHLINCNVVLIDSPKDLYRNRGGDNFVISPLCSGSNATGWIATEMLGDGAVSLATAMAISGAAANPNTGPDGAGVTRNRLVSFLMSLFNVRLGYWMANPAQVKGKPRNRPNLWFPGLFQGLFGRGLSERASFVELTDGGHYDNTGIYELVRRRTRLIIVAQASCDPSFTMQDLANVIEKVRVDFSAFIEFKDAEFSLNALRPPEKPGAPAASGFAIGRVRYPKGNTTSADYDEGYIVYLQAAPIREMPSDVTSYWWRHKSFPNDTTADQFFTEANLEAYRELGYAAANAFYRSVIGVAHGESNQAQIRAILKAAA